MDNGKLSNDKEVKVMVTIITDSSSYFKESEAHSLGIKIVPLGYTVDGQGFYESYSDKNEDLETLLSGDKKLTTSQPNISAFLSAFEEELKKGNEVLCITLSSRLSGTYSTAQAAAEQAIQARQAEQDAPTKSENITVFDSLFTGGGLYLLIKEAKKLIAGGMNLKEITQELTKTRDKITLAFSVDDMTPLRNSGRLGFVRRSIATFLNIKPILLCKDGAVISDKVVHGSTEIIKIMAEKVTATTQEIVISAIGENRMATNLYHVIKEAYPEIPITIQKVGPALGIHLGLRVIAISLIEK